MNYYMTVALVCLFSMSKGLAQQQKLTISLTSVLEQAGANNLTIQQAEWNYKLAVANHDKAREWWLPNIYTGASIHQLSGADMNTDGRIFTSVDQQNFWGGLGLNFTWDFGKDNYTARSLKFRAQASRYEKQSEKNNVLLDVVSAYFDLLSGQLSYQMYDQLLAQTDTITKQLSIQVEAGLQYESQLLLARSDQNHLRVQKMKAKMAFKKHSTALAKLLNISPEITLVSSDTLLVPIHLIEETSLQARIDSTFHSRPEFSAAMMDLEALKMSKKMTTEGLLLPEIQLGSYSSFFGKIVSPLYFTNAYNLSLLWKIPIGRLTDKGELKQINAKISTQRTKIDQVKNQVRSEIQLAKETLMVANEQMNFARDGSMQAEKALKQGIMRQNSGTVVPYEIIQSEENYITSRLDYLEAVSTYNKAQYKLFVALGNNL